MNENVPRLNAKARRRLAAERRPLLHLAVAGVQHRVSAEPNAWAVLWDSEEMRELRRVMEEL